MKKVLFLSLLAATVSISSASFADDHGDHDGKKGGKFKEADANGDGVISKDEHRAMADKRFEKIDTDNDGTISKEEGKAFKKAKKEKRKDKRKDRKDSE